MTATYALVPGLDDDTLVMGLDPDTAEMPTLPDRSCPATPLARHARRRPPHPPARGRRRAHGRRYLLAAAALTVPMAGLLASLLSSDVGAVLLCGPAGMLLP